MDPATGTGYVTVTDPDGNIVVDDYDQGALAAETDLTASAVTSERDYDPITWAGTAEGGTLFNAATTNGDGQTTSYAYDPAGNIVSSN